MGIRLSLIHILLLTCFLVPSGLPLLGMLFFGNLLEQIRLQQEKLMQENASVSYTHLDVYKRQFVYVAFVLDFFKVLDYFQRCARPRGIICLLYTSFGE